VAVEKKKRGGRRGPGGPGRMGQRGHEAMHARGARHEQVVSLLETWLARGGRKRKGKPPGGLPATVAVAGQGGGERRRSFGASRRSSSIRSSSSRRPHARSTLRPELDGGVLRRSWAVGKGTLGPEEGG
jgi:hypothetical protein